MSSICSGMSSICSALKLILAHYWVLILDEPSTPCARANEGTNILGSV